MESNVANITPDQLREFIVFILALAGVVVLIGNVVKTFKEWRKPSENMEAWKKDIDRKLDRDDSRLKSIEEGNKVVTRGVLALISHEINGNSNDKLKASQQEITNYLIDR